MKNNKLISILLALLVCLSMVVSVSATESELIFTLESDSSVEVVDAAVVEPGDIITVSVNISSNPGILTALTYVEFDSEKLELVSSKALVKGVKVPESAVAGRVSVVIGDMQAAFYPNKYEAVTTTGAVAELTFKVLVETDAKVSVNLKASQGDAVDANGKFGAITVKGDVLDVNVVGEEHDCEKYETVEANNEVKPTCTEVGKKTDVHCAHCGTLIAEGEEIEMVEHTAGEVVVENNVDPTCTEAGKYDNVVYCTECEAELSRETIAVDALGHTAGEVVVENNVDPTCTEAGKYDNVVYCTVCEAEMSRETVEVPAKNHVAGEAVVENKVDATCSAVGSYDEVTYCTVCDAELTREAKTIEMLAHTAGAVVVENEVATSCSKEGSYDNVTYCTVCNTELSRETKSVAMLAHTIAVSAAVPADCLNTGLTAGAYCSVCETVLVEQEVIPALGHKAGNAVVENKVDATCTEDGKHDNVVYCSNCNAELSRENVVITAAGHVWGEWNTTTAPTCAEFGVQTRICAGCDLTEEDATVPATGEHKFGEWKVTTPATTEAEGEETRTCECGEKETRSIAKLPVEPAPKNNTLLIVIIVVVVLAGAGVAAFFVLKNKKK